MNIVNMVMQALSQFLPFAGGTAGAAVITGIGTDLYDKSKEQAHRLLEAIRQRFARENDGGSASQVLQLYANGDRDMEGVVKTKLERILSSDPDFAANLLAIMRNGPLQSLIVGEEATAERIEMSNSQREGTQIIQEGKRAVIRDVKMNITSPEHP